MTTKPTTIKEAAEQYIAKLAEPGKKVRTLKPMAATRTLPSHTSEMRKGRMAAVAVERLISNAMGSNTASANR